MLILGLKIFNLLINDLGDGLRDTFSKFGEDVKLRGVVDMPEGYAVIQRNFHRTEKWTKRKLIKFNKDEHKLPHLGRKHPTYSTCWGLTGWKAAWQKTPWVSWWTPNWSWWSNVPLQQRRLIAFWDALGEVLPADWGRGAFIYHLFSASKVRTWSTVSRSGLLSTIETWARGRKSNNPQRWLSIWSISSMRKGWDSWECLSWRRGCLRGVLLHVHKFPMKSKDEAKLFFVVPSDRTRDSGHKMKPRRLCLTSQNMVLLWGGLSIWTGHSERLRIWSSLVKTWPDIVQGSLL